MVIQIKNIFLPNEVQDIEEFPKGIPSEQRNRCLIYIMLLGTKNKKATHE